LHHAPTIVLMHGQSMILDRIDFKGRAVIVSGAGGGGIGSATCVALAEVGARVIAVDIKQTALDELTTQLEAVGANFDCYAVDVCDTARVEWLMAELDRSVGLVQHLVNVVGGVRPQDWGGLEEKSEEQLEQVLNLNLQGAYRLGRRLAQRLIDAGEPGSIVNVSSLSAHFPSERGGLYAIAKAGLEGMTRAMAVSWGQYNIRCNAVAPGRVDTPAIQARVDAGEMPGSEAFAGKMPLGRTAPPDEIATPIVFMLSDLASYVTGQSLLVDGGASIRFMITPD
jgi:3-oxoacyl-[acyl-carrier protein] reductase